MKQLTSILHNRPDGRECIHVLHREYWGEDNKHQPQWHMTCNCGFVRLVDNETFLKWQYCDRVVDE